MNRPIKMLIGALGVGLSVAIIAALILLTGTYAMYALMALNFVALSLFAFAGTLTLGSIVAFKKFVWPFARNAFAAETFE